MSARNIKLRPSPRAWTAGRWHDFGLLIYQPLAHGGPPFIGLGEVGSVLITLGLGHLACWPAFVRKEIDLAAPVPTIKDLR